MPRVKVDYVVSFSSEDSENPANNLLASEVSKKKWLCGKGETSGSVVLQLSKTIQISALHIGAYHAALVEVLVGRSETPNEPFKVLVPSCVFLSPTDSRKGDCTERVRSFTADQLADDVKLKKWDRVRVVCSQPYNKHCKYGLSFIHIFEPEGQCSGPAASAPKQLFTFDTRSSDEEECFKPGELFAKHLQNKGSSNSSTDAQIRQASSHAIKNISDSATKLVKTPISKEKLQANSSKTHDSNTSRQRNNLMYDDDDEQPNAKVDKVVQKHNDGKRQKDEAAAKEKRLDETPKHKQNDGKNDSDKFSFALKSSSSSTKKDSRSSSNNSRSEERKRDKTPQSSGKERDSSKDGRNSSKDGRNSSRDDRDRGRDDRNSKRDDKDRSKDDRDVSRDDRDRSNDKNKSRDDRDSSKDDRNKSRDDIDSKRDDRDRKKRRRSGERSAEKSSKRLRPGPISSSPHTLLSGVVFVLSGYENPRRGSIRDKALALGATYCRDWEPKCTHLICAFPNTPKLRTVRALPNGKHIVIVRADWIEQCCQRRRLLPWQWYATEQRHLVPRINDHYDDTDHEERDDDEKKDGDEKKDDIDCDTDDEIEKVLQKQKKESESQKKEIETQRKESVTQMKGNEKQKKENETLEKENEKQKKEPERLKSPQTSDEDKIITSQDSDVSFVKDERIKGNYVISDSEGEKTDEDQPEPEVAMDEEKTLPDFLEGYTFVVDEGVAEAGFDRELLIRYVRAYGGENLELSRLEEDSEVSYVLSASASCASANQLPSARILRADWLWQCHRKRRRCSVDKFLFIH